MHPRCHALENKNVYPEFKPEKDSGILLPGASTAHRHSKRWEVRRERGQGRRADQPLHTRHQDRGEMSPRTLTLDCTAIRLSKAPSISWLCKLEAWAYMHVLLQEGF